MVFKESKRCAVNFEDAANITAYSSSLLTQEKQSGNRSNEKEDSQANTYDKNGANKSKYESTSKQKEKKTKQKEIMSKNIEQIASKQTKNTTNLTYLNKSYLNNLPPTPVPFTQFGNYTARQLTADQSANTNRAGMEHI